MKPYPVRDARMLTLKFVERIVLENLEYVLDVAATSFSVLGRINVILQPDTDADHHLWSSLYLRAKANRISLIWRRGDIHNDY